MVGPFVEYLFYFILVLVINRGHGRWVDRTFSERNVGGFLIPFQAGDMEGQMDSECWW